MTSHSTRYQFTYDEDGVRADLVRCRKEDAYAYRRIIVILEDLLGSPSDCERFVQEGWQDDLIENVSLLESLQRERINGIRVKFWDIRAWRLLFLADHRGRQVALVAIMPRDDNYEAAPGLWDRIRNATERLGFGRY